MSVLLDLPHKLLYHIVIEWIDPTLFLAFTHLDNAVRFNSNLRLTLLNHYEASCRRLPFPFKWKGGYYCLSRLGSEVLKHYLPSFVGIRIVIQYLNLNECQYMDEFDYELAECLLSSCIMTELYLNRDDVLKGSCKFGLSYLKILQINYKYAAASVNGCLCIRNSCTKLKKFIAGSEKGSADNEVRQVMNEIVANNHNLEYLTVFTTNDIFNILPVNCKQLKEVELHIDDSVEVEGIYNVTQSLPLLARLALQNNSIVCEWIDKSRYGDYCEQWDFNTSGAPVSLKWGLQGINNCYLADIAKYFASTTTSLKVILTNQNYSESEVQSLQRTILDCSNLAAFQITPNASHNDLIDILQPVAAKLQKLIVHQCKVSTVIEVLKCCQNLTHALFYEVRDESTEQPWVIEELKNTIAQYPIKSVDVLLMFHASYVNYSLSYKDGEFTGSKMNHYWK